jgi:hypothetical protein
VTVDEIKAAIEQLAEPEREKLADWFEQLEEAAWDAEMEQDFSPGGVFFSIPPRSEPPPGSRRGRGRALLEKINQEIDKGKFSPLEEGLRSRRERH